MQRNQLSGFTLLEILMAVALVAIVSAVALPRFIDFRTDAHTAVTTDRMSTLREAIVRYSGHLSSVPTALTDLTTQGAKPAYDPINKTGWRGPYVDGNITGWDKDAWGTTYQYNGTTRTLRSCGKGAACGDADDLVISF